VRGDFLERLESGEVLVAEGPIHTLLEEKGRSLEGQLGEWIVDNPDDFQTVLKATYEAGCDLGHAGTQGNGRYRLADYGLEDKVYELTLKATQLAKKVTPKNCYLLGTVGISGRFLEPVGDMTVDEAYESFKEQIIPMLEGGVDVIRCVENDTEQVAIAIKAVRDLCDLPVRGDNVFYPGKTGIRTMMGVDVKTAAARLQESGADVIGATCGGFPIEYAITTVKEMRQACSKPLMIKPDPGLAQLVDDKTVQPVTPEEMAREVSGWIAAGASIVGGCCGATLEHLRMISAVVKAEKS